MVAKDKKIKLKLNIMLLKANLKIDAPDTFINGYDSANELPIDKKGQKVILYKKIGNAHQADWVGSFEQKIGGIDLKKYMPSNASHGVTLFIEVDDRIFAVNWGLVSRHNIIKDCVDKKFGIYTANKVLGESENARLKSANSRVNETNPVNKQRQYGITVGNDQLYMSLEDNEALKELIVVDKESPDFYRMIGKYNALGIQLVFKESEMPCLSSLSGKLKKVLDLYKSVKPEDVRKLFKGICPVDDAIVPALFVELEKALKAGSDAFFLFEPEIDFDFSSVSKIKFIVDGAGHEKDEMLLSDYLSIKPSPKKSDLESDMVIVVDEDDDDIKTWSVFDCLYGELDYAGTNYIISDGEWFEVIKDKYDRITKKIASVENKGFAVSQAVKDKTNAEIANATKALKGNEKVPKERIFNTCLCDEMGGELFDEIKKQITLYEDKFEVCDILMPAQKEFIHVKYNSGAQSLSHLFSQGYVSANAYGKFSDYADQVNAHIADANKHILPDKSGSTIHFVIINGKKENRLTFFTKMSFEDKITTLEAMGFKVKLSWAKDIY